MADSIPVLWPDNISVSVVSPLSILRAQVAPLQKMTKGLLLVNISTRTSEELDEVVHSMDLVAPALNNYRHQILSVTHSKDCVYPAKIEAACFVPKPGPDDLMQQKAITNVIRNLVGGNQDLWPMADSEEAFIKYLGMVLKSQEVRSIIDSLLAKMNEQNVVASSGTNSE